MNVSLLTKKIKMAYEVSTNAELAQKLEISTSTIEAWSRRKEIPQKYIFQCTIETGVSLDWLLNEDKPTFNIRGGTGNVGQQNNHGGEIINGKIKNYKNTPHDLEDSKPFEEKDPVFLSFQKAYESTKKDKNKLNELEDLLDNFYKKYR